eukprot:bmy_03510T0
MFTKSPHQEFTDHLVKSHTRVSAKKTQAPAMCYGSVWQMNAELVAAGSTVYSKAYLQRGTKSYQETTPKPKLTPKFCSSKGLQGRENLYSFSDRLVNSYVGKIEDDRKTIGKLSQSSTPRMDGKYECLLAGTLSRNGNFNIQKKIAERKGLLSRKKSPFNKGVKEKEESPVGPTLMALPQLERLHLCDPAPGVHCIWLMASFL